MYTQVRIKPGTKGPERLMARHGLYHLAEIFPDSLVSKSGLVIPFSREELRKIAKCRPDIADEAYTFLQFREEQNK